MKNWTMLLLLGCCSALNAAEKPGFYVVEFKEGRKALVHATSKTAPQGDLAFVATDSKGASCCIRLGVKPAAKPGAKPRPKAARLARRSDKVSQSGDGTEDASLYQYAGYLAARRGLALDGSYALAFGIEGMGAVQPRGQGTYAVSMPSAARSGKPQQIIVRHCLSSEGLHFKLYRSLTARKPYAGYYYYLGYDVEPDCRE